MTQTLCTIRKPLVWRLGPTTCASLMSFLVPVICDDSERSGDDLEMSDDDREVNLPKLVAGRIHELPSVFSDQKVDLANVPLDSSWSKKTSSGLKKMFYDVLSML